MRTLAFCFALTTLTLLSCNKEPAKEVKVSIITSFEGNTINKGEAFYIYTRGFEGDFACYYKGEDSLSTYGNLGASGLNIDLLTDSVLVPGYSSVGVYPFTVLVSSSGNWGEDFEQAKAVLNINVIDPVE